MKFKIKLYRGDVFATVFIYIPFAVVPINTIFEYNEKLYKIIDCVFTASDTNSVVEDSQLATLTVVEIPN